MAEINFRQKDYEKAKEIVREILMIIQSGYFPDGTSQMEVGQQDHKPE